MVSCHTVVVRGGLGNPTPAARRDGDGDAADIITIAESAATLSTKLLRFCLLPTHAATKCYRGEGGGSR